MPEHDAAYPAVRRNYADIYCSDDREYCRIVDDGEQLPGSTDLTLPPCVTQPAAFGGPGRQAAQPALLSCLTGAALGRCPGRGKHLAPAPSRRRSRHRQRRTRRTGAWHSGVQRDAG